MMSVKICSLLAMLLAGVAAASNSPWHKDDHKPSYKDENKDGKTQHETPFLCSNPDLSTQSKWIFSLDAADKSETDCSALEATATLVIPAGVVVTIDVQNEDVIIANLRFVIQEGGRLELIGDKGTLVIADSVVMEETGGAILVHGQLLIDVPTTFINNQASIGGAMAIEDPGEAVFKEPVTFKLNAAVNIGGALRIDDGLLHSKDLVFIQNTAGVFGGGVSCDTDGALAEGIVAVVIEGDATFIANAAMGDSGAFDAEACSVTFKKKAIFIANTAEDLGGAMFALEQAEVLFEGEVDMTANTSNEDGGALAASDPGTVVTFKDQAQFIANTAVEDGGAVFVEFDAVVKFDDVLFIANVAGGNGDDVAVLANGDGNAIVIFKGQAIFKSGQELGDNVSVEVGADAVFVNFAPISHGPEETFAFSDGQLLPLEPVKDYKEKPIAQYDASKHYSRDTSVGHVRRSRM